LGARRSRDGRLGPLEEGLGGPIIFLWRCRRQLLLPGLSDLGTTFVLVPVKYVFEAIMLQYTADDPLDVKGQSLVLISQSLDFGLQLATSFGLWRFVHRLEFVC
jgi:hypothetical protein